MTYIKKSIASLMFFVTFLAAAQASLITVDNVGASSTLHSMYTPNNLINGSGLSGGLHDSSWPNMWLNDAQLSNDFLIFDLGGIYDITSAQIWNYNWNGYLTRGVNNFDFLTSVDGITYNHVSNHNLAIGNGSMVPSQSFTLSDTAQFIKIEINSNHGHLYTGLSEVQFFGTPGTVAAPLPEPSTYMLMALGLLSLSVYRKKKRK